MGHAAGGVFDHTDMKSESSASFQAACIGLLTQILEKLNDIERAKKTAAPSSNHPPDTPTLSDPHSRFIVTRGGIDAGKWITCKEACDRLGIVKSTLVERLNAGVLRRFHKKGDEHLPRPRVWLSKEEVDQYYQDYTLRKGKEK